MNIIDFLNDHNIEYREYGSHHHTTMGRINFDCPLCSPNSQSFRLGWHLSFNTTNCWQCGKLSPSKILQEYGLDYIAAKELLLNLDSTEIVEREIPTGILKLPSGLIPLKISHLKYLKERGFNPKELDKLWNISQSIDAYFPLAWRIFIPVFRYGRMISWTTRNITDTNPRYINARITEEAYPMKKWLYGMDYCRNTIIITEGCTDTWNIGPGAVATMGIDYTAEQMELIRKFPVRVVCFDSSIDAQKRQTELIANLSLFPGETYGVQLDAADPGSAHKREIRKLREEFLE